MPPATLPAPSTAERVRSACMSAGGAVLAADGAPAVAVPLHHLLPDGKFAVTIRRGTAPSAGAPAMLELTDYAPLPLREPVRALVWVRGRVGAAVGDVRELLDVIAAERPHPALLAVGAEQEILLLEPESIVAADATGAHAVGPAELLAAEPDPFCEMEGAWVRHLDSSHPEVLARLAARLPATLRRGSIRPLGLDRYGVRLRIEGAGADTDVRLSFPAPVHDLAGLGRSIRLLMGCPFVNPFGTGLRARRG